MVKKVFILVFLSLIVHGNCFSAQPVLDEYKENADQDDSDDTDSKKPNLKIDLSLIRSKPDIQPLEKTQKTTAWNVHGYRGKDPNTFNTICQRFANAVTTPDENDFYNHPTNFYKFIKERFTKGELSLDGYQKIETAISLFWIVRTAHPVWRKFFAQGNPRKINMSGTINNGKTFLHFAQRSGDQELVKQIILLSKKDL